MIFKLSHFMKKIMKGLCKAWTAGEKVTIDESMIRYFGRAVCFVQYMPCKPIKHGIKVFAVCCAYTAVLLGFKVYVGTEQVETVNTVIAVVQRMIEDGKLDAARGRTLYYTDNWYT